MSSAVFSKASGFTLIEVMIAMAILAALSLLTAQTLKSTFDNRAKIHADLSREEKVYDALRIMQDDVGAAFHYRDYQYELLHPTDGSTPIPGVATPTSQGTPTQTPVQVTAFIGDNKSMYFSVMNHPRTIQDSKESDQAKIGYFLKSCHSARTPSLSSDCLYRGFSKMLDDEPTKLDSETMLLENVVTFKLRYLGPGHDDYVDVWKTGDLGNDPNSKLNFPFAVEITLVTQNKNDHKDRQFGATVLAPIRFPNNPKPTPIPGQATPAPGPAANGSGATTNAPVNPGQVTPDLLHAMPQGGP